MKTKFYLIVIMFIPIFVLGQNIKKESIENKAMSPVFTGIQEISANADELLRVYLCDNFNCSGVPETCLREGTVVVKFKVLPSGELTDFEVSNSVCKAVDQTFINILKSTEGMWKSSFINDTPRAIEKEVSIMFVKNPYVDDPKKYFTYNAKLNFKKGNKQFLHKNSPQKALKFYDKSIKYRPNETASLLLRGLCRYSIGDIEGARGDWNKINALEKANADEYIDKLLGKANVDEYIGKLCNMEGYAEMQAVLNK